MKRLAQASLIAVLAISSVPAPTAATPVAAAAAAPVAALPWYREIVFYSTEYSPGTSPFPGPGPTPWGTETRVMVGWIRYYCNGNIRSYGMETGDYEDYFLGDCP